MCETWRARQDSHLLATREGEARHELETGGSGHVKIVTWRARAGLEPATPGLEGCVPVSEAACVSTGCEDCHADVPRDRRRG